MVAILNFRIFHKNRKTQNACISNTVRGRVILAKFLTHRISVKTSLSKFQQILHLPKMAAILNFRIFFKNEKHRNAYISKTMLDRAISTKLLTHRVSIKTSLSMFQRIFHSPKMAAILNFQFFFKNAKHKIACILKTVLDRAISTIFDL